MEISGKDEKIVASVFASRGEPEGEGKEFTHVSMCTLDNEYFDKGDIAFTDEYVCLDWWSVICTIEEYNQCIEDMYAATWMNNGTRCCYKGHIEYCKRNNIDTSNKELLKEHCDYSFYEKPLVYTQEIKEEVIASFCSWLINTNEDMISGGEQSIIELGDEFLVFDSKTPEQIKQDKLKDHIYKISKQVSRDYRFMSLEDAIFAAYDAGYIVEPK